MDYTGYVTSLTLNTTLHHIYYILNGLVSYGLGTEVSGNVSVFEFQQN